MVKAVKTKQEALNQLNSIRAVIKAKTYLNTDAGKQDQVNDRAMLFRAYMVYETLNIKETLERELQNETA